MTQANYNNYVNIVRARHDDLANKVVNAYAIGNYTYYNKRTYDLAIIEAHLEMMEEYTLPLRELIILDGYESPNFLTHLEMQSSDSLIQNLLNLNYQIDFLLDLGDGYIIDHNNRPVLTQTGEYLIPSNSDGSPVYLKDALKDPSNVEYIYATAGYKLDGGEDDQILTSDDDGMGTWEDNAGDSSGLEYEIDSKRNVGGIYVGDVFLDNSSITDLLKQLLIGLDLKSFRVNIPTYTEVGVTRELVNTQWETVGLFDSLVLTNTANIASPVYTTGLTEYTYDSANSFVLNTNGSITWRLSASSGNTNKYMEDTKHWVYPSFYGFNTDGSMPTESDFENKVITNSANGVKFPMRTTSTQWGWFAVPADQTGRIYTEWDSTFCGNDQNKSTIDSGSFIDYKGTIENVGLNNLTYNVYQYTEDSMLDCDILLK